MILLQITLSTITIVLFSENVILIDLKLKWRNIQKTANNIIFESRKTTRGISQVGPKPGSYLDYPGLDTEKLNQNKRLWDLYDKCLQEHSKTINKNHIFKAKVINIFRSTSISLECELCISPKDLNNKNVWYYSFLGDSNNLSLIQENEYFRVSSLDLSLNIINVDESKSGFYQCKMSSSEAGPYFIELIKDNGLITEMNSTQLNYEKTRCLDIENIHFRIWNIWTQWTMCSKCDMLDETIYEEHNITKSNKDIHLLKNLMDAFNTGLPCQSSLLDLNHIKNETTKVIVEYCKVKCNHNDVFEVKDIHGNIKEKVNNTAGTYSPLQIMPEQQPKVEFLVIIVFLNQKLNVSCPGNLNSDAPYEWRLNNQIILPNNERITVDILNRLIFKNITENDEQIYTCWQVDYLAGIVQIKIVKEFKISIYEDMYLYGVFLVLGIFIWVGFKMFFDRDAAYY